MCVCVYRPSLSISAGNVKRWMFMVKFRPRQGRKYFRYKFLHRKTADMIKHSSAGLFAVGVYGQFPQVV